MRRVWEPKEIDTNVKSISNVFSGIGITYLKNNDNTKIYMYFASCNVTHPSSMECENNVQSPVSYDISFLNLINPVMEQNTYSKISIFDVSTGKEYIYGDSILKAICK